MQLNEVKSASSLVQVVFFLRLAVQNNVVNEKVLKPRLIATTTNFSMYGGIEVELKSISNKILQHSVPKLYKCCIMRSNTFARCIFLSKRLNKSWSHVLSNKIQSNQKWLSMIFVCNRSINLHKKKKRYLKIWFNHAG